MISESGPGGVLDGMPVGRQLGLSLFQSISCRTAGFAALPDFASVQDGSKLLMITLMFIGCAPASMGGGITTGTFAVLVLALLAYVRRRSTPVVRGRAIPGEMIRKAAAVLTVSLGTVLTASWLIMITHGSDFEKTIFEVVSAFATCGLTLDFTTSLNPFGQTIIILMMFWGRLGALTVLFALTRPGRQRRVNFPEEKVLIG
jgi:trk system potassium uptake protein TrkH